MSSTRAGSARSTLFAQTSTVGAPLAAMARKRSITVGRGGQATTMTATSRLAARTCSGADLSRGARRTSWAWRGRTLRTAPSWGPTTSTSTRSPTATGFVVPLSSCRNRPRRTHRQLWPSPSRTVTCGPSVRTTNPINVFTAVLHDAVVRNRNGRGHEPTAAGEHTIGTVLRARTPHGGWARGPDDAHNDRHSHPSFGKRSTRRYGSMALPCAQSRSQAEEVDQGR